LVFVGGEKIRLGDDWQLEVLHVPGHSYGHLGLYDPKHETAFVSDALHGGGFPGASGGLAFPVTYYDVDAYLSTLTLLENLPIKMLCTAHWLPKKGEEIRAFVAESRQTVATFDRIILSGLNQHSSGLTMKDLIDVAGEAFGWPSDTWVYIMFALKGHPDRLQRQRRVRFIQIPQPYHWVLA
jgi:glyoxylase-like metal-dependent hydrolase (beta-lactamase superfamily II)